MEEPLIAETQIEQFWAEMRSTCYLFSKSNYPTQEQAKRLVAELHDLLGQRIITYPQTLREFGITQETSYKLKKLYLGIPETLPRPKTEAEKRFIAFMGEKAAQAAKGNWTWRITQEAYEKQENGWFPFFVTLTVDPKMCCGQKHQIGDRQVSYESTADLWKQGREFRLYIRKLAEISARELGHPPPRKKAKGYGYRPESDYVTYAGVLEHGKSEEHHHAHLMVWMRAIPTEWKVDPNEGRLPRNRTQRECLPMRTLWPWAIASQKPALYFRSKGDIWSQMGHITPLDKKTGQPIKMLPVQAVGNYVTKYMQKGDKQWFHRMKCTRNLGLQKLVKIINRLDNRTIQALAWKPENSNQHHLASMTHSVPLGLIRSLARRKNFAVNYRSGQLDLKTLMKTNYEHFSRMLMSVRGGARPDRMPLTELYDWAQKFLPDQTGYCEKRLLNSHKQLAPHFPRNLHKVQPITLGANDIGFTSSI